MGLKLVKEGIILYDSEKKITRNNFLIKSLYKLNPFEQNYQPLI